MSDQETMLEHLVIHMPIRDVLRAVWRGLVARWQGVPEQEDGLNIIGGPDAIGMALETINTHGAIPSMVLARMNHALERSDKEEGFVQLNDFFFYLGDAEAKGAIKVLKKSGIKIVEGPSDLYYYAPNYRENPVTTEEEV